MMKYLFVEQRKKQLPSLGKTFPSAISRCNFFGIKLFLHIEYGGLQLRRHKQSDIGQCED